MRCWSPPNASEGGGWHQKGKKQQLNHKENNNKEEDDTNGSNKNNSNDVEVGLGGQYPFCPCCREEIFVVFAVLFFYVLFKSDRKVKCSLK